ncbi:hypothetical protein J2X61_000235 [Bacillus sp. 3255]|nr:hypothetical protein [Bacillus sp. 3255]
MNVLSSFVFEIPLLPARDLQNIRTSKQQKTAFPSIISMISGKAVFHLAISLGLVHSQAC